MHCVDEGATFFSNMLVSCQLTKRNAGKMTFWLPPWPLAIHFLLRQNVADLRSKRSSPCPHWCQPPNSIDVPGSCQHPKISPQKASRIFTTLKLQTKDGNKIYQRQVGHLLVAQRGDISLETNVIFGACCLEDNFFLTNHDPMNATPHNSESKRKKHARHNHRCFLAQVSSPNEGWNCLEGKILVPTNGDPGIDEYLAWKPPFFSGNRWKTSRCKW